ncbi:MAG: integrative and conjugative element protein (TIGR02256 family) [Cocleimonas sp.]|jgi:integrative and conjugative element protein (TIGR02256 family)
MNNEWIMPVDSYGDIRITSQLISELVNYCQIRNDQPEAGGVLIGKHLNSGGALLIDDFTPPQASDKQGRCLYFRSLEHNKIVTKIWQNSNHHSTYVGLWHTHPEPIPNYSATDKKDWLNALKNSTYAGSRLFFIIIGQTHIRCWVGTKYKLKNKIELLGQFEIEK